MKKIFRSVILMAVVVFACMILDPNGILPAPVFWGAMATAGISPLIFS